MLVRHSRERIIERCLVEQLGERIVRRVHIEPIILSRNF